MAIQLSNYEPALKQGAVVDTFQSATGTNSQISANGTDASIGITLLPKGTNGVIVNTVASTTGINVDIVSSGLTTGTGLDMSDADALTTGVVASFVSNSSDASTRSIVLVKQDHASATAATALTVHQDGGGTVPAIMLAGVPKTGIDLSVMTGTAFNIRFTATTDTPVAPSGTTLNTGWMKVDVSGTARYIPFYK